MSMKSPKPLARTSVPLVSEKLSISETGNVNEYMHILVYENAADREACRTVV